MPVFMQLLQFADRRNECAGRGNLLLAGACVWLASSFTLAAVIAVGAAATPRTTVKAAAPPQVESSKPIRLAINE